MTDWARSALIPVGAYALGCVIGAYYLVRLWTGKDLRALGSGNPGATNAGRILGPGAFVASFAVDAGKGALTVWGARALGAPDIVVAVSMVAVVAGHTWPAQLGFRGGKGAATAMGVLAVFDVTQAAILLGVGLLVFAVTRRYEIGGFVALFVAPPVAAALGHSITLVAGLAVVAAVVAVAHRLNALPAAVAAAPFTGMHGTGTAR